MNQAMERTDRWQGSPWRIAMWGAAALLLALPAVAMLVTAEMQWSVGDFVLVGTMLLAGCVTIELAARSSRSVAYSLGSGVAVASAFLLILVNGAVGFLGSEDNPANLVFFGVIAVAVLASVLAGFRAAGMSRAMFAAALAQLAVGLAAIPAGWASPGADGLYEVALGTGLFCTLWLVAAGLFRKAAREQGSL